MQVKPQWDTTSYSSRWLSSKLESYSVDGGVGKREPSDVAGGDAKWYNHIAKYFFSSLKS
jgi:hypothetical protein